MNAETNGIDLAVVKQPQVAVLGGHRVRMLARPVGRRATLRGRRRSRPVARTGHHHRQRRDRRDIGQEQSQRRRSARRHSGGDTSAPESTGSGPRVGEPLELLALHRPRAAKTAPPSRPRRDHVGAEPRGALVAGRLGPDRPIGHRLPPPARPARAADVGAVSVGGTLELAAVIEQVTGVQLTPSVVRRLLRERLGWSVQRP
jgi:Winged helix-turn helix